jgi:hypothetical protein
LQAVVSGIATPLAYFEFYNTFLNIQSGSVAVPGGTSFHPNSMNVGISQSLLGIDGQTVGGSQPLDDQILQTSLLSLDLSSTATLTDLGGNLRQITFPIAENINMNVGDGASAIGTLSGTLVMTGTLPPIPEPSSFALAITGLVGLVGWSWRRKR